MTKEMTCIVCPIGCPLKVSVAENGQNAEIFGNTCKRGAEYARTECTDPRRILTTTLRCADGSMIAVKTDKGIPKDKMFEAMKRMNGVTVQLPVMIGDVLIKDVFGSNLVATQNRK